MAESGHGYDPLRRYQPQPPYASQPYPSYSASSHSFNTATRSTMANGDAARLSFNHNSNVIPGLGLGFAGNAVDWQNQRNDTSKAQASHDSMIRSLLPGSGAPTATRYPSREVPKRITPDDQVEDGEVYEGEMGDTYEPTEMKDIEVISRDLRDKNGNAFPVHVHVDTLNCASSIIHDIARERSGSYSPYLSPREINRQHNAETPILTFGNAAGQKGSSESQMSSQESQTHSQVSKFLHVQTVAEARKQAQDAILRLWPLNVRYQNYLDEGIDDGLLKSLFKDLGFDIGLTKTTAAPKPNGGNSGKLADVSIQVKEGHTAPGKAPGTEAKLDKAQKQDKSEERKDRIARLLAAKTSKPSGPAPQSSQQPSEPIHPPQSSQPPQPPPPSHPPIESDQKTTKSTPQAMSQSEKSKLLHQKMEALRKAHEARGQKRPYPEESEPAAEASNMTVASSDVTPSSNTATADGIAKVKDTVEPSILDNGKGRADASPAIVEEPSLSTIPGLFLSSTPQPSPTLKAAPGRHSAPVTIEPDERPFKRPFGQRREPRPFLIDVSDDEDDAEMDIDSPEHHSSSIYRLASPVMKTIPTKSAPSHGENGLVRQFSSPIRTPTGMNGDGCTKEDLQNMHKKIEAMKQKILEAEARKKAKNSRPESEASTPSNGQIQGNSSESVESIAPMTLPPPLSPAVVVPPMSPSPPQPVTESSSQKIQTMLQNLPMRRSFSRSASERLPLLEARRREQQLRLKLLQSQMAGIEKEIEESLQEEERLKGDVEFVEPLEEGEEQASMLISTESPALIRILKAASAADAMDTTSVSSASSDKSRHSRLSTSDQRPSEKVETSSLGPTNVEDASNIQMASASKSPVDIADSTTAIEDTVNTLSKNEAAVTSVDEEPDVGMNEDDSSNDDLEDASDSYEPPEADFSSPSSDPGRALSPLNMVPTEQHVDKSDENLPDTSSELLPSQHISAAQEDAIPETQREVEELKETIVPDDAQTSFAVYETPLQHFHAYRFHREFSTSVAGGLRSLTYSNKVDVKKELCPDDLAGRTCPRGKQCEYQHFETMQAPDDQILLQLGAFGNFDEKQKQDYNTGLRQLLIEFRNNKVKDFTTISRGIIDYRAQFLGDESKILPLGNVTI